MCIGANGSCKALSGDDQNESSGQVGGSPDAYSGGPKRVALWDFGNAQGGIQGGGPGPRVGGQYHSRTLSSSFFLPQSAAAFTKASTTGCGFFSVEDSWGWNSV